jgi:hypothetical protein
MFKVARVNTKAILLRVMLGMHLTAISCSVEIALWNFSLLNATVFEMQFTALKTGKAILS